jgi:hypothetical protein
MLIHNIGLEYFVEGLLQTTHWPSPPYHGKLTHMLPCLVKFIIKDVIEIMICLFSIPLTKTCFESFLA